MEKVNNVFTRAMDNINTDLLDKENGDYVKDGIIYCGLCNTPRQKFMNFGTGDAKVPINCDCRQEKREKLDKEFKEHEKRMRIGMLRRSAFNDNLLFKQTFENDDGTLEHRKIGINYVDKFEEMEKENIGLILTGNVGTGKTYLASSIANALIDKGISVKMTNFSVILNDMTNFEINKNEYIKKLNKNRLLIIDDFGIQRDSAFAMEHIFNIIDSRYRVNKPLIITTNLNIESLTTQKDLKEKRIYSRILEMATPIIFTGENHRLKSTKEKARKVKNLLIDGR